MSRYAEYLKGAKSGKTVRKFSFVENFMAGVVEEIYAADSALRMKAAKHVKAKIYAKISDVYYEGFHSKEGEAPGMITGNLRKGLRIENKKTVALVGFGEPAYHAPLLEFGTTHMGKRPILGPTFVEEAGAVKEILSGRRV